MDSTINKRKYKHCNVSKVFDIGSAVTLNFCSMTMTVKFIVEIIILPRILDTTVEDIYMYVVPQSTLSSCDAQHIYEPVASPRKSPVTLPVTSQWTSTTPSQGIT